MLFIFLQNSLHWGTVIIWYLRRLGTKVTPAREGQQKALVNRAGRARKTSSHWEDGPFSWSSPHGPPASPAPCSSDGLDYGIFPPRISLPAPRSFPTFLRSPRLPSGLQVAVRMACTSCSSSPFRGSQRFFPFLSFF